MFVQAEGEKTRKEPSHNLPVWDGVDATEYYYRDNLLNLLVALNKLGYGGSGDWFCEWIYHLENLGGDPEGGNQSVKATIKELKYEFSEITCGCCGRPLRTSEVANGGIDAYPCEICFPVTENKEVEKACDELCEVIDKNREKLDDDLYLLLSEKSLAVMALAKNFVAMGDIAFNFAAFFMNKGKHTGSTWAGKFADLLNDLKHLDLERYKKLEGKDEKDS